MAENNPLIRLIRVGGGVVSINVGMISSVEDMDGHTVVVCGGADGDVYHVEDNRADIERMVNNYLRDIVVERLKVMEVDPNWASTFREAVRRIAAFGIEFVGDEKERTLIQIYQQAAAEWHRELQRMQDKDTRALQELYNRAIERYRGVDYNSEFRVTYEMDPKIYRKETVIPTDSVDFYEVKAVDFYEVKAYDDYSDPRMNEKRIRARELAAKREQRNYYEHINDKYKYRK